MSMCKLNAIIPGLVAVAMLATTTASPAAAQGGVELTPLIGAYVPTSNSIGSLGQDFSRETSAVGGARLTFWGSGSLSV